MCDDFLYHHNVLTHHFLFYHYPLLFKPMPAPATPPTRTGRTSSPRGIGPLSTCRISRPATRF
ncbi:MAG: hypothetical protein ACTFAK_11145 [Candidatus Electronema sp. VV]